MSLLEVQVYFFQRFSGDINQSCQNIDFLWEKMFDYFRILAICQCFDRIDRFSTKSDIVTHNEIVKQIQSVNVNDLHALDHSQNVNWMNPRNLFFYKSKFISSGECNILGWLTKPMIAADEASIYGNFKLFLKIETTSFTFSSVVFFAIVLDASIKTFSFSFGRRNSLLD